MALKPLPKMILILGAVAIIVVAAAKFYPDRTPKPAIVEQTAPPPIPAQAMPIKPTMPIEVAQPASNAQSPTTHDDPIVVPQSNNVTNGDAGMAALLKKGQK